MQYIDHLVFMLYLYSIHNTFILHTNCYISLKSRPYILIKVCLGLFTSSCNPQVFCVILNSSWVTVRLVRLVDILCTITLFYITPTIFTAYYKESINYTLNAVQYIIHAPLWGTNWLIWKYIHESIEIPQDRDAWSRSEYVVPYRLYRC